jgi:phenylalanyl-tRNA synthetase beta chain
LAIVVDNGLALQQLIDGMATNRPPIIQDIRLFDVYTGKGVAPGKKSLAFRIVMQDTQRTLQDAEVDLAMQQLVAYLEQAFAAQLRV